MIEAKNLTKRFGEFTAIDDVSCCLRNGQILGMVGSNGAGKSTLLRMLSGVYKPDAGELLMDGEPIWENTEVKERIAYVADELYLPDNQSLADMERLYRQLFRTFDAEKFRALAAKLSLDRNKRLGSFSKGMRRQAAIILALSRNPKCLFLDETFDGIDPITRAFIKRLICTDVIDHNASAIITSHSLRELEDTCDALALLHRGKVVFESDIASLKTHQCKVQIAFPYPFEPTIFEGIEITHFGRYGSIANMIVNGDREEVHQRLAAMQPSVLDVLPLSLEEVFTYELGSLGYVFEEKQEVRS